MVISGSNIFSRKPANLVMHKEGKMSSQTMGLVIGGFLPAIFFGLSGVFAKPSNQLGIGTGLYLMLVGFAAIIVGFALYFLLPDKRISFQSGIYAFLVGLTWAFAAGLVAIALSKYSASISKLVPLYNTNTLIAVAIGLIVFAEWKEINIVKLIIGSVLIVLGCTFVVKS